MELFFIKCSCKLEQTPNRDCNDILLRSAAKQKIELKPDEVVRRSQSRFPAPQKFRLQHHIKKKSTRLNWWIFFN